MASTAFDSEDDFGAAKVPVSQHPAFPAIVALWFAALLGLGSLVLPAVLLEKAVMASGIAALVPSASPPLGFTARALIAIGAAVAGAGLGIYLARRVAQSQGAAPRGRTVRPASALRRPISAKDELGGEAVVNGEGFPITRRRALAISEDDRPSDFLYRAPLPDSEDGLELQALAPRTADCEHDVPLELDELAAEDCAPESAADEEHEEPEMTDRQEFRPAPFGYRVETTQPSTPVEELQFRNNRAGPRGFDPLPFSPPSLARRAPAVEADVAAQREPEPEAPHAARFNSALDAVGAAPAHADGDAAPRANWESAALEELGLVQLVQRLGATIERRREQAAAAAIAPAPAPAVAPALATAADFEPAPAEEAVQAMAAFFAPGPDIEVEGEPAQAVDDLEAELSPEPVHAPSPRPGLLSAFEADIDESDDDLPDFTLPLRSLQGAQDDIESADAASRLDPDFEGESEEPADAGYSSLLGLGNPFATPRSGFVRIEEPEMEDDSVEPAVVFPGHRDSGTFGRRPFDAPATAATPPARAAAPVAAEADEALRAALATLQRMSGAA